jgi:hypothetical protein
MILRKQFIGSSLAQQLEDTRRIRPMINIHSISSQRLRHIPRIRNKPPAIRVDKLPALPGIIRRLAAHNNLAALCDNRFPRFGEVVRECVDGDCLAVVRGFACLGAGAGADGAAVVAAGEGAAVVVAEFYDDDVVGFDGFDDLVEAAFDGEGTGAATADSFIDYGDGEGVWKENAPAWLKGLDNADWI